MATSAKTKKTEKTDDIEQLNETGVRSGDRRKESAPVKNERRKGQRRRLIDPTTCERDYSQDEIEFMKAMDQYKRTSGRMFPTCSEILEVLREMGYRRLNSEELAAESTNQDSMGDSYEGGTLDCEESFEEECSI